MVSKLLRKKIPLDKPFSSAYFFSRAFVILPMPLEQVFPRSEENTHLCESEAMLGAQRRVARTTENQSGRLGR